jgi:hypothetical protein
MEDMVEYTADMAEVMEDMDSTSHVDKVKCLIVADTLLTYSLYVRVNAKTHSNEKEYHPRVAAEQQNVQYISRRSNRSI